MMVTEKEKGLATMSYHLCCLPAYYLSLLPTHIYLPPPTCLLPHYCYLPAYAYTLYHIEKQSAEKR